jgi:hypothetical protein
MRLLRDAEPGEIATPPMFGAFDCFGVTRRIVASLYPILEPPVRTTSPFRERVRFADCVWLEPRLRAELTFSELVKGRLRDPVFRGLVAR